MGPGRIPWTALQRFVETELAWLAPDQQDVFKAVILEMDAAWTTWAEEVRDAIARDAKDPKSGKGGGKGKGPRPVDPPAVKPSAARRARRR